MHSHLLHNRLTTCDYGTCKIQRDAFDVSAHAQEWIYSFKSETDTAPTSELST